MDTYELEDLIKLKQECIKDSERVAFHALKYRYARRDCNPKVIYSARMDLEAALDRYEQDQISLESACERYSAKTAEEEGEE